MKTLDRYVLGQFTKVWLVAAFGTPLLFIIIRLADDLDSHLSRGLTAGQVLMGYVYDFPYQLTLSFPVACLFGAVFTIALMSRHFEISAAKASGVSFYRIIAPMLAMGAVLSLIALALGEVVPTTNRLRAEVLGERGDVRRTLRTRFVYGADGGRAYTIRRLVAMEQRIDGIVIDREGSGPDYPTYRLYAPNAIWEDGSWRLTRGHLHLYPAPDRVVSFAFDTLVQADFSETPEELLAEPKEPEEMDYRELGRFIESIERTGGDVRALVVERMLKIAFPFACLIVVVFGAPLGMSTGRRGPAVGVGIALASVLIYLIMVRISQALGAGGLLEPWLAAWLPNMIFLGLGVGLLARTRT